jgi:hypothetical protein
MAKKQQLRRLLLLSLLLAEGSNRLAGEIRKQERRKRAHGSFGPLHHLQNVAGGVGGRVVRDLRFGRRSWSWGGEEEQEERRRAE